MSSWTPTVSVQLPEAIYRRLKRVAESTHRPVEDVLADTVEVALPQFADLPEDLAAELVAMDRFSDDALQAAAESSLSRAQQRRLNQLTHAGGSRALTPAETAELTGLIEAHDQAVLRRARALALLAYRGYPVARRTDLPRLLHDDRQDF
jgi:hypothetical protein